MSWIRGFKKRLLFVIMSFRKKAKKLYKHCHIEALKKPKYLYFPKKLHFEIFRFAQYDKFSQNFNTKDKKCVI